MLRNHSLNTVGEPEEAGHEIPVNDTAPSPWNLAARPLLESVPSPLRLSRSLRDRTAAWNVSSPLSAPASLAGRVASLRAASPSDFDAPFPSLVVPGGHACVSTPHLSPVRSFASSMLPEDALTVGGMSATRRGGGSKPTSTPLVRRCFAAFCLLNALLAFLFAWMMFAEHVSFALMATERRWSPTGKAISIFMAGVYYALLAICTGVDPVWRFMSFGCFHCTAGTLSVALTVVGFVWRVVRVCTCRGGWRASAAKGLPPRRRVGGFGGGGGGGLREQGRSDSFLPNATPEGLRAEGRGRLSIKRRIGTPHSTPIGPSSVVTPFLDLPAASSARRSGRRTFLRLGSLPDGLAWLLGRRPAARDGAGNDVTTALMAEMREGRGGSPAGPGDLVL